MAYLIRALAVNSTLEKLNISKNNIGNKGIGQIATTLLTNTTLKILNISSCLQDLSTLLEGLDTDSNYSGISDLVAELLARALVNSSLEELNIIDNKISDNGIWHIN